MTEDELDTCATNDKPSLEAVNAHATNEKLTLTDDYRDFLVRFNGFRSPGPPYEYTVFNGKGPLMQQLATYDELYSYATPDEDGETYVYRFDHCVIGTDLSGDEIILISEPGKYHGHVFLWDHESEAILLEYPEDEVRERLDALETGDEQIELLTEVEAWTAGVGDFGTFIANIAKG